MKKHILYISKKKYSEKILEENINLFDNNDWECISMCQKLSESFIER